MQSLTRATGKRSRISTGKATGESLPAWLCVSVCVCVSLHREVFLCTGDRLTASVCSQRKTGQRAAAPNIRYLGNSHWSPSLCFLSLSLHLLPLSLTPPLCLLLPTRLSLCLSLSLSLFHCSLTLCLLSLPSYISQQLDHQAKITLHWIQSAVFSILL